VKPVAVVEEEVEGPLLLEFVHRLFAFFSLAVSHHNSVQVFLVVVEAEAEQVDA